MKLCPLSPMRRTRTALLSTARAATLAAGCAVAIAVTPMSAAAQAMGGAGIDAAKAATEPSYVLPYFLLILSIALGLLVVCRPSRRKNPAESGDKIPAA